MKRFWYAAFLHQRGVLQSKELSAVSRTADLPKRSKREWQDARVDCAAKDYSTNTVSLITETQTTKSDTGCQYLTSRKKTTMNRKQII